jgi:tRNA nucleotidyltransferase (CCA-adding enzyme)
LGALREVLSEARRLVEPGPEERARVGSAASRLLEACGERFRRVGEVVDVSLEGSVAKDTWIRGRPEVDVFVHLRPEVPEARLEELVITGGREVLEGLGGRSWLRYASHPYIEGELDGVRVNIVGCFSVPEGAWKSAVDRTPYHTRHIKSVLGSELRTEVRLLKGFLIGVGVYGAEIRVEGFSGYLSELLTASYGGFEQLIRAASGWRPPVTIDMSGRHAREAMIQMFPNSGLVVIDPVDPGRNVASAVSLTSLSEFILASKLFLRRPSLEYFKPSPVTKRAGDQRQLLGLFFRLHENLVPDILWGELKRTMRGVARRLESEGFRVYRAAASQSGGGALILLELDRLELPRYELRRGPPVWMEKALDFVDKALARETTGAGPWVDGERLYALVRRDTTRAKELVEKWFRGRQVAVSRHLASDRASLEVLTPEEGLLEKLESDLSLAVFKDRFLAGLSAAIRLGEPDD